MNPVTRRNLIRTGATAGAAATLPMVAAEPAAARPASRPGRGVIRVLVWNIYQGGHGVDSEHNLRHLLDQLVAIEPDVFLAVETYGSGPRIRDALARRCGKGAYTGIQLTQRPSGEDNLWLFTHLPVLEVYQTAEGDVVTDFNLGGARLGLPGGRAMNVFDTWLNYTDPWIGYLIDENAAGIRAGQQPRHPAAAVVRADQRQTRQAREIVDRQLPAMLGDERGPVLIGGDLNTLPAMDWTPDFADSPNHLGMTYPLTASRVFQEAGFTDLYRTAHPDAAAHEGRTWCPLPTERMITPQRIDMLFGRGIRVRDAATVDERMPEHGAGTFYSDHAAIYVDLHVR